MIFGARMGRLLSLVTLFLTVALALLGTSKLAGATTRSLSQDSTGETLVEIVKVSGLLDDVLVDFVERRIALANREGITAIVLQLNSKGAVVSDDKFIELARIMRSSKVPVGVWVGPSGAQAEGAAAQLAAIARPTGVAAGARVGKSGQQILPEAEFGALWGAQGSRLRNTLLKGSDKEPELLRDAGLVLSPVLVDFVGELEGVATKEVQRDGERTKEPQTSVRFTSLTLWGQLMHTVASPQVAYLLMAIGLGLLVFELFTAGVGVAGVLGAVFVALGAYGLVALPTRWWAFALLVLAFVAFAIDVQTGVPRFWTGVGVVLFVVASLSLFGGVALSWVTIVVGVVGALLAFLSGMPSMVRTRFSTPTIGRDWMIGEFGLALSAVDPDGTVSVRSARWPARTNRATPITAGDRVRVTGINGIILEVEPETGAARDHRERRGQPLS